MTQVQVQTPPTVEQRVQMLEERAGRKFTSGDLIKLGVMLVTVAVAWATLKADVRYMGEKMVTAAEVGIAVTNAIRDHERNPHPGAVSREEFTMLLGRIDRIEQKLDILISQGISGGGGG